MKNSNNCLDPEPVLSESEVPVEKIDIVRIRQGKREELKDSLVREVPLTINFNKKELVTLLCTPKDIEDLVRGFLFTSGAPLRRHKIKSRFKISSQSILSLMREFQRRSTLFKKTGAVHSAALSNGRDILIFREDIGRHSAVDKIIGRALVEGIDMRDKIILSSGRISSEILLKAQKCVIPVVISRGAPTSQAVKLARDLNITVVGFARGDRVNVYSGVERIR